MPPSSILDGGVTTWRPAQSGREHFQQVSGRAIRHLMGCEHVPRGIGGADDMGHHIEAATAHSSLVGPIGVGEHLLEHVGPAACLHEHPVSPGSALHDGLECGPRLVRVHAAASCGCCWAALSLSVLSMGAAFPAAPAACSAIASCCMTASFCIRWARS